MKEPAQEELRSAITTFAHWRKAARKGGQRLALSAAAALERIAVDLRQAVPLSTSEAGPPSSDFAQLMRRVETEYYDAL